MLWCFNWFHQKIDGFLFHYHGWKSLNKKSLEKNVSLNKNCNTDMSIWTHVLTIEWISPIFWKKAVIFETQINRNLRCSHGYTNCVINTDLITWVSKNSWERSIPEFSHAERISACPRTIICTKYEQNNMRGDILNAGTMLMIKKSLGLQNHIPKLHLQI